MPIVSNMERLDYLRGRHPILFKLCNAQQVPSLLTFRCNTALPFCYGRSCDGSPIPVMWDTNTAKVVPLWENVTGVVAIRVIDEREEFIQIDFEDPDNPLVVAYTSDGLLAYVFLFLLESIGNADAAAFVEIERLASWLTFSKLELVVRFLQRWGIDNDYAALWEFTRSL